MSPRRHAAALAAPLLALVAVSSRGWPGWWSGDDPCLLASTALHGPLAHFVSPDVWRAVSGSLLMPMVTVSMGVDLAVFGWWAAGHYAHQLVSLAALVAILYGLAVRVVSPLTASGALTIFVLSAPTLAVATQLANRPYAEGAALAAAALWLYGAAVDRRSRRHAIAGAFLFAGAAAFKEPFVPLLIVLPLLPVGSGSDRVRAWTPYALVAVAYAAWRTYMLGPANVLDPYVSTGVGAAWSPDSVLSLLGWRSLWQRALGLALVGATLGIVWHRKPHWRWTVVVLVVVLAAPLALLGRPLAPRHLFAPMLFTTLLLSVALEIAAPARRLRAAVLVAVAILAAHATTTSPLWETWPQRAARFRGEGQLILQGDSPTTLITGLEHGSFLECTARIRDRRADLPARARFCGDPCICGAPAAVAWSSAAAGLLPAAPPESGCSIEQALAVDLRFDAASGRLSWRFGPYTEGQYAVLLASGPGHRDISIPLPLPAAGAAPFAMAAELRFIVRYRSPDGWATYSPLLAVGAPGRAHTRWERRGQ